MSLPKELRVIIAKYFPICYDYSIKVGGPCVYLTYNFDIYQNTLEFMCQGAAREHNLQSLATVKEDRADSSQLFYLSSDMECGRNIFYSYNKAKNCFVYNNGPNRFELPTSLTSIIIKIIELINQQDAYTAVIDFGKSLINGKIVD